MTKSTYAADDVAIVLAGIRQADAREGLATFEVARGCIARFGLPGFLAILGAEREGSSGLASPMSISLVTSRFVVHCVGVYVPS